MKKYNPQKSRVYLSIELLKSFSKKELEGLQSFAENKYFNTDSDLVSLIEPLKKYAFDNEKFTSGIQLKVYKDVFGNVDDRQIELTKKQVSYLTNKLNALLRVAEQFLMIDYMKNKPDLKFELLYPQLIDKKQTLLFNRHLKRDQKKFEQETKRGDEYHDSQYKLQNALLIYYSKEGLFTETDNYEELQYQMDMQYLLNKLKYHLAQLTLNTYVTKKQYDFSSFNALENLIKLPVYNNNSMIQLYCLNIELLKNQDNETYHSLLKKLGEENDQIPTNFLRPFYSNITNFCVFNIKKGKLEYHQKLFDLYKQMHQKNLMLKNEEAINIRLLKNVISASCVVNEFEWAKKILYCYNSFVSTQIQKSVLNYNLGKIAFEEGMFEQAHGHLAKVEKIDRVYDIDVKILILKCIFENEKNYNEATQQSFYSAKVFFKRNAHLTLSYKKGYINFIQILAELYKYKHQESNKDLCALFTKLEVVENINSKNWLVKKIHELKKTSAKIPMGDIINYGSTPNLVR